MIFGVKLETKEMRSPRQRPPYASSPGAERPYEVNRRPVINEETVAGEALRRVAQAKNDIRTRGLHAWRGWRGSRGTRC